jgi:cation transport regulator ChaC
MGQLTMGCCSVGLWVLGYMNVMDQPLTMGCCSVGLRVLGYMNVIWKPDLYFNKI